MWSQRSEFSVLTPGAARARPWRGQSQVPAWDAEPREGRQSSSQREHAQHGWGVPWRTAPSKPTCAVSLDVPPGTPLLLAPLTASPACPLCHPPDVLQSTSQLMWAGADTQVVTAGTAEAGTKHTCEENGRCADSKSGLAIRHGETDGWLAGTETRAWVDCSAGGGQWERRQSLRAGRT